MTEDYRAAAERLLNRLRGQGTTPATRTIQVEPPPIECGGVFISNPHFCTVIVHNYSQKGDNPDART
jgi:hypothetical protein